MAIFKPGMLRSLNRTTFNISCCTGLLGIKEVDCLCLKLTSNNYEFLLCMWTEILPSLPMANVQFKTISQEADLCGRPTLRRCALSRLSNFGNLWRKETHLATTQLDKFSNDSARLIGYLVTWPRFRTEDNSIGKMRRARKSAVDVCIGEGRSHNIFWSCPCLHKFTSSCYSCVKRKNEQLVIYMSRNLPLHTFWSCSCFVCSQLELSLQSRLHRW